MKIKTVIGKITISPTRRRRTVIILLLVLVVAGGLVWGQMRPKVSCEPANPLACVKDTDCLCVDNAGCFLGSQDYYRDCVGDKTGVCFDFCGGWGQPPVRCIDNRCSNSYHLQAADDEKLCWQDEDCEVAAKPSEGNRCCSTCEEEAINRWANNLRDRWRAENCADVSCPFEDCYQEEISQARCVAGRCDIEKLSRPTYCQEDGDCVLVNTSCCSCSSGGGMTCINRGYLDSWLEKLGCEEEAGKIDCPAVYNCGLQPTGCRCVKDSCQGFFK